MKASALNPFHDSS